MATTSPPSTPGWQREKHLHSGDTFWVLTNVQSYTSPFHPWSEPQELFRVGIYDLKTGCLGYANFGKDIVFAILKAGIAPPRTSPLPVAIELHRDPHEDDEKGRYRVSAKLLPLDPDVALVEPRAKPIFASFTANAVPGMWDDLAERATRESAIETAVEAMRAQGEFSAGDIKKIVGKVDVTPILKDLVARGVLLPPTGKKRGTKYRHVPLPIIERSDWTG
jgi:hypothetical protein